MASDTLQFIKGSTFEFSGQMRDPLGAPIPIPNTEFRIYETLGSGLQDLEIAITDAALGKFKVTLEDEESLKLPEGRSSWFKLQLVYTDTTKKVVFPPIWIASV